MKRLLPVLAFLVVAGCAPGAGERYDERGVSEELAKFRKEHISDVHYRLFFSLPSEIEEEIPGSAVIAFELKKKYKRPLLIDFNVPEEYLKTLSVNNITIKGSIEEGHISIPASSLVTGTNIVEITFRTGEMSLNRNREFLYTLLVPDRASTAFPCFDQPDIKGKFSLTLEMPEDYEAMSNNEVVSESVVNGRRLVEFGAGKPVSTYLFAFAAGKFERIEAEREGLKMEMLHRESDTSRVNRNIDAIFSLHAASVRWMEEYTGIEYPFDKFGFVLIPSFQYGGMEHPGSIFYRSSTLMTDESPTMNELLSRASLIAHETSHIWFGDLVTMKWFDDVWLKEVFAGYMADKIVNPSFPEADHDLRFLLSRYPAAYAVDRTSGANPVIQELDNLKNAGSLYGGIIYNKAPIIMKHLDMITGDSILRESLRVYLSRYSYGNAEWDDLVGIIEEVSGIPLREWSNVWVREPGMPEVEAIVEKTDGKYRTWFHEKDPSGAGRHWQQRLYPRLFTGDGRATGISEPGETDAGILTSSAPTFIIHDTTGVAYGFFRFDSATATSFTNGLPTISDKVSRGVVWINAWENMLNGVIPPASYFRSALQQALAENDVLLRNYLSGRVSSLFWNNLSPDERDELSVKSERLIWEAIGSAGISAAEKRSWMSLYRNIALTGESVENLYSVWESATLPGGHAASEEEQITLALTLALKRHPDSKEILSEQADRIRSNDRLERFMFVMQAVSAEQEGRDRFFESLRNPSNREKEPWVLEALGYLHHPLLEGASEKYILPSLELLEEIKYTGDIFFPAGWISTTLGSYQSESAYNTVTRFLEERTDYPGDLKLKILQAADNLIRHNEGIIK